MPAMRLCFAGTPAFAAAHLQALLDSPHEIAAVFTQPDRPAGRGRKLTPSAVSVLAEAHGLPLHKPAGLRGDEAARLLASYEPDVFVVAAYGLILPASILEIPRYGCVNVHASLLPRWRGAAPVERALLAGDRVTGITIMHMDEGLDTGDLLHRHEVEITQNDDREILEARLVEAGQAALLHSLENLPKLLAGATRQDDSLASYANKLDKADAMIDWATSAEYIGRQVRAGIGRAPAFAFIGEQRVRILRATPEAREHSETPGVIIGAGKTGLLVACGKDAIRIEIVQMPGKTAVPVGALLNSPSTPFVKGAKMRASFREAKSG